jgi:hypothetical protein
MYENSLAMISRFVSTTPRAAALQEANGIILLDNNYTGHNERCESASSAPSNDSTPIKKFACTYIAITLKFNNP